MAPNFLRRIYPLRLRQIIFQRLFARNGLPGQQDGFPLEFAPASVQHLSTTDVMHQQIAWLGFYDLELTRRISCLAEEGGVFVDVGANIGYFSLIWAGLRAENTVEAFEPSPAVNTWLRANVERANLGGQIRVHDCALGKTKGGMSFDPGPADQSGWGGLKMTSTPQTLEVKVERLDELIAPDATISVLKIDTEGADAWVLKGAERMLREQRVRHVFFERNGLRMRQLGIEWNEPVEFLNACGYQVTQLSGAAQTEAQAGEFDELHAAPRGVGGQIAPKGNLHWAPPNLRGRRQAKAQCKQCFLLGCSGSGKSLLANALRSLDGALFANELIMPTFLAHLASQPLDPTVRGMMGQGIMNHLLSYVNSGEAYSRSDALLQWLRLRLSFLEFSKALAGQRAYDLLMFESNFFSLAPEILAEARPDAFWIFSIRDGRDCADSLQRNYGIFTDERLEVLTNPEMPAGRKVDHRFVPWWVEPGRDQEFLAASPYGRAVWMWKATVRRCHEFRSRLVAAGNHQFRILKYEDLVHDPVGQGTNCSVWLGKPVNAAVRRQLRRLHPNGIGKYRRRPQAEIEEASRIARPELELFGYL